MMESSKFWVLKSKGKESSFGGNTGYDDEPESHYVYNTTVKNHDKIKAGDFIVIVDKKYIKGIATIEKINVTRNTPKKRYRCPECGTQEHYTRKSVSPKFKCRKKHEFDMPDEEDIMVDEFKAIYSSTFIKSDPKTSVKLLDSYYINRNIYYSIQQAKVDFIQNIYPNAFKPVGLSILKTTLAIKINITPYIPSITDSREYRILKSAVRPKQDRFRSDLIKFYGAQCMLTGCDVLTALEASHICPYRGGKDNHIQNGLLLRRDLHALYDADLIGICPADLTVALCGELANTEYAEFEGKALYLNNSDCKPSSDALEIRWKAFQEKNHEVTVALR